MLGACNAPPAGERSGNRQLSGPVGLEGSVHPLFQAEGRMTLAGCCSLAVTGSSVRRLEGDVDGREIEGPGYSAVVSFGNGLARGEAPAPLATVALVDGVELEKRIIEPGKPPGPRYFYRAIIPLDEQARARNVREPGLEITGSCSNPASCNRLAAILDSLRF